MLRLSGVVPAVAVAVAVAVAATVSIGAAQNPTRDFLDTGISVRGLVKLAPQDHENGSAVAFMLTEGPEGKVSVVLKAAFEAAFPGIGKPAQQGEELTAAMFRNMLHAAAADSFVSLRFADQNPALQAGDIINGANTAAICAVDRVDNQLGASFALKCLAGDRKIEPGTRMNFEAVVIDTGSRLSHFLDGRQAVWVRLEE